MLRRYNDFKKHNEGMKKFSKISKDSKKGSTDEKGKAPNPKYLNYEEEINSNILAQEKPRKDLADDQTNIHDTKTHSQAKSTKIQPNDESEYHDKKYEPSQDMGTTNMGDGEEPTNEKKKVRLVGKVAKFPKDTKASKAYSFLENVKISKNKIWYLLVEKQDNELQMVKYATKKGVNLSEFVNELKKFYINKHSNDPKLVQLLERIELGGDEEGNFSSIRNIPNISIDGTKLIRKITEDLTTLLSGKLDEKRRR